MFDMKNTLLDKIKQGKITVGVVGLGYVGLPLLGGGAAAVDSV